MLSELRGKKVRFVVPQRGEKKRLMELSVQNAKLSAEVVRTKNENARKKKDDALMEISEIAGITRPAVRIESYDISHVSGSDAVGVMVYRREEGSVRFKEVQDKIFRRRG